MPAITNPRNLPVGLKANSGSNLRSISENSSGVISLIGSAGIVNPKSKYRKTPRIRMPEVRFCVLKAYFRRPASR
jgi:hypothetical protein